MNLNQSGKRFRTAAAVGLAFLTGIAVFTVTFKIIDHFRPPAMQPLFPISERHDAGPLLLPALNLNPAEKQPADWSLEDHRGKIVLINYFATWCGPCQEELPDLIKLASDYQSRGIEIVLVSLDKDNEQAVGKSRETVLREFAKSHAIPFPILLPPDDSLLWKEGFPLPQTFIIDRQGRRAQFIVGQIDPHDLRNSFDTLLKEPS